MRIFKKTRLAYFEDVESDPGVRFKIMHNPAGDWDRKVLKEIGGFEIGRLKGFAEEPSSPPRIWSSKEFRYGRSFIYDDNAYIEVNKRVVPKKNEDTGKYFPYNPGIKSLEPDDKISIWDMNTRTFIFIPSGFEEMTEEKRSQYLKGLAQWLDTHSSGRGRINFNGEES